MADESPTATAAVRHRQAQARAALWEAGLDRDDLAERLGAAQNTLGNRLTGRRLDLGVLTEIAAALDTPITRFLPSQEDGLRTGSR